MGDRMQSSQEEVVQYLWEVHSDHSRDHPLYLVSSGHARANTPWSGEERKRLFCDWFQWHTIQSLLKLSNAAKKTLGTYEYCMKEHVLEGWQVVEECFEVSRNILESYLFLA